MSPRPIAIRSPWLDARVGLSPPAVDLAKDGFALIGGRVEVVGDGAVRRWSTGIAST